MLRLNDGRFPKAYYVQLYEEPLINLDGTLAGHPLGFVHHSLEGCKPKSQDVHFHVVWVKGKELRRSKVDMPVFPSRFPGDDADHWNWLSVHLYCGIKLPFKTPPGPAATIPVRFDDGIVDLSISSEHAALLWPHHFPGRREAALREIEEIYDSPPRVRDLVTCDWAGQINKSIRIEKERRARLLVQYRQISQLRQIFVGA
ncbi:hypothetical protein [Nonomuraea sp. NPDC001023]|uniref:hypothetical protein n=1 Tax=unclassified Nonomuraea TaxID=2593643 RepID=UPI003322E341